MPLLKKRRGALTAVVLLVCIGAALIIGRHIAMQPGEVPAGDEVWRLRMSVDFEADKPGARLSLPFPLETPSAQTIAFQVDPTNLRSRMNRKAGNEPGGLSFESYGKGDGRVEAWFDIHVRHAPWDLASPRRKPSTALQKRLIQAEPGLDPLAPEVVEIVRTLKERADSRQKLPATIFDFLANELIEDEEGPSVATDVILQRRGTEAGICRAGVVIFRACKIPAQRVQGFRLVRGNEEVSEPASTMEAWFGGAWHSFDPSTRLDDTMPQHFIPMKRGNTPLVSAAHGKATWKAQWEKRPAATGLIPENASPILRILDLTRLPPESQAAFLNLLVLPFGVLIVTLSRNLIGVNSIGVFTPALVAMSLLFVDARTAATVFAVTLVVGVLGRSLLPGLKLMRLPRLSVVFTMVVVIMAICLSTMAHLGMTPPGELVLLPTVVLATLVDRVYTVADEDGKNIALRRLGWTVLLALACAWLFKWSVPGRLVLHYPEVHFLTIAALIFLGLYDARQLSEIPGLRFLAEPKPPASNQNEAGSEDLPPAC